MDVKTTFLHDELEEIVYMVHIQKGSLKMDRNTWSVN